MRLIPWMVVAATVSGAAVVVGLARHLSPTPAPAVAGRTILDMAGAVTACERAAGKQFPSGTARVTVDDHSSRFDKRSRQYRIFLQAVLPRGQTTELYYISCYVSPQEGVVVRFESLKENDGSTGGGRRFWGR